MVEEPRAQRARNVLTAACAVAEDRGLSHVTKRVVALRAGVATGTVINAFGSMDALREEVLREAVRRPMLSVLAEGIIAGHEIARAAPGDLKQQALAVAAVI